MPDHHTPTPTPPTDRFKVELEGRDGLSIYDTSTGIVNILRVEDGIALANQLTAALDILHPRGGGGTIAHRPNPTRTGHPAHLPGLWKNCRILSLSMNPDIPISIREALDYEVRASWWARFAPPFLHDLTASYFAWKVRRRYNRYRASRHHRAIAISRTVQG